MSTLDKDFLELLTPEERAAVEDPEFSEAERAAMQRLAGDDDGEDGDDDATDVVAKDTAPPAPDKDAEPQAPAPAPAAQSAADTPAPAPAPAASTEEDPIVPVYKAALPEDYEAKTTALKTQEDAAWDKFDAGDLDKAALQAELRTIESQRADLNSAKLKAEIAGEMTEQQRVAANNTAISRFLTDNKSGIDYETDKSGAWDELRGFVQALENKPENATKPLRWLLDEAHKRVLAFRGIATPPPPAAKTKEQILKEATDKRKQNIEGVPKTLAQVPGGEGPGDVGDEFSDIDALEGEALEAAIKRMSPAQREKYAAAA